jgi:hypothetical protein
LDAVAGLSLMRIEDGEPILIAMEDDLVRRVAAPLATGNAAPSMNEPRQPGA